MATLSRGADGGTVDDTNGKGKGRSRRAKLARLNHLRKKLRMPRRPRAGELPEVVAQNHRCYKFTYLVMTMLVYWMVVSLDKSWLYLPRNVNEEPEQDSEAMTLLWLTIVATWLAYFAVQGTDAGYIRKANEVAAAQEGKGLLQGDGGGGDSSAGKSGDAAAAFSESIVTSESIVPAIDDDDVEAGAEGAASSAGVGGDSKPGAAGATNGTGGGAVLAEPATTPLPKYLRGADMQGQPKWCEDCNMWMPLRAKHCRICNMCVATFDHHCTMIGTCIGERNHCRFWWFLFFQTLEICVAISIVHSGFEYRKYYSDWMSVNSLAFFAVLILYILLVIVGVLFVLHSWLAMTAGTTYELGKDQDKIWYLAKNTKECDLPFSAGICGNLRGFCCVRDGMWECIGKEWRPMRWRPPGTINRDSDDVWDNCWENKYWSCC